MEIITKHKQLLLAVILSLLTYIIFYGSFLTSSKFFWAADGSQGTSIISSDIQAKHLPARAYLYEKIVKEHTFPFWTERMYSGFPIYADPETAYLNPLNVASILIFGPQLSFKILHLLEYLVGSLSLYFLLKRKGLGLISFTAANTIFYFNSFFTNHQIHYTMIMSFYLFPTTLLLADLFLEKKQLRYIILASFVIANGVLWGHMQMVLIMLIGLFIYMVVFSWKKTTLPTFIFYFFVLLLFLTIETLPQILPTRELLTTSNRSATLNYLKASFEPRMVVLSFVPYLLGDADGFDKINPDYTYTEIYTYVGISSVLLSFLALLFLKKSREVILAFIFIWVFLILGFMRYNDLIPHFTPIITLFRDWGRAAILGNFGVALLAGIMIEKLSEVSYKNLRQGLLFALSPIAYITILNIIVHKSEKELDSIVSFSNIIHYPEFPLLSAIFLIILILSSGFLISRKFSSFWSRKFLIPIQLIFVSIIFFDLFYFNQDILSLRLRDISYDKVLPIPEELKNKRVLFDSFSGVGNESLYYSSWYPAGTNQLKDKEYVKYYKKLGIELSGITSMSLPSEKKLKYNDLKNAGITALVYPSRINYLNNNSLDLIENNLEGSYIQKQEGRVAMTINNPADTTIKTYLKYSPYWQVKIDGETTPITKDTIFFNFSLPKGDHLIEIRYYPWPFIWGVIISSILLIATISLYSFFRKRLYSIVLK